MGSIAFVVWRECLEGFLVMGLFYAWRRRESQPTNAIADGRAGTGLARR